MEMRDLPLEEKVEQLRKPEVRAKILTEESFYAIPEMKVVTAMIEEGIDKIFRLGDPPGLRAAAGAEPEGHRGA